ncbi:MAG TPA: HEAT repeat domain-containing protein [bacterium]|nr:hypothetical protein [Candidatus Omnitrophota bacterium]HOJ61023.1 HEAT repeat domain-containing protein [bacterium]HOL94962.1 HEAT repeat domain-containing protein [bacterium]HPP01047.1 HEAT repeat domain-containing protein [bacterium]HXK92470.1 HEAT repeat domain-containing protein [bacterium]
MLTNTLNIAVTAAAGEQDSEAQLIEVLQSNAALKEKLDACRGLARVGSKAAVPVLAALLEDKQLAHMARYALETIPDPSVDDAFRAALGKLQGNLLAGVIGSIGVRRDTKAVESLTGLLKSEDLVVSQAAARALGNMGTLPAARAIESAMAHVPEASQLAFCEGLFRCAEKLRDSGLCQEAWAIYDRMRQFKAPHQVITGAHRGATELRP